MNVVTKYATQVDFRVFVTSSKTILPLIRAFMDDLNLMITKVQESQVLLNRVVLALRWARMLPSGSESRSLVMENGRVINYLPFLCYLKIQLKR